MDDMLWRLAAYAFNSEKIEIREHDGHLELFVRGALKCAAWSPRCSETALAELVRWRLTRLERLQARTGGESVRVPLLLDDEPLEDQVDDVLDPPAHPKGVGHQDDYDASTGVVRVRLVPDDDPPDDRSDGNAARNAGSPINDGDDEDGDSSR